MPGVGIGAVLIALGAILRFAVTAEAEGFNVGTVGVILMIVGGLAVLLSALFWSSMFGTRERTTTTDHAHMH